MRSAITGSLDGLSFGTGPDGDGWSLVVNKWNGWYDSPPGVADITPRPDASGSYRGRNLARAKRFTLECTARSESPDTRELLMDKIVSILTDEDTTYPLVRNEITRTLMIWVERDGSVVPIPLGDRHIRFVIPLVASDPYKYTDYNDPQSTPLPSPPTDGILWDGPGPGVTGTQWDGPGPGITGWQYQTTSGGSGIIKLTNSGTAEAPIEFTISATAINPKIVNIQTQQIIRLGATVASPSQVTINTKTGQVLMDAVDVTGLLTNSDFFGVPPRSSVDIAFSADAGSVDSILTARNANVYN
jgi:hypothetical protein